MFKDGRVHGGRLCVLQYFTECVVYHLMKNDMEKDALEINGFYSSYKYELTHPSVVTIEQEVMDTTTPKNVCERSWKVLGKSVPKTSIQFITQVIIIYVYHQFVSGQW